MPRPRSDDKRSAILAAAARVIVTHGLGAPTALIAQEAGVSNGSLFTYFGTKGELFNELYLDLKAGMATAAFEGLPAGSDLRGQFLHVWTRWMKWAMHSPEKRRALAQLSVSDEITLESREKGHRTMAGIADLMERGRANGPLREAPKGFVVALMNSIADATMDFMMQDPAHADRHSLVGFEALWRVLS